MSPSIFVDDTAVYLSNWNHNHINIMLRDNAVIVSAGKIESAVYPMKSYILCDNVIHDPLLTEKLMSMGLAGDHNFARIPLFINQGEYPQYILTAKKEN